VFSYYCIEWCALKRFCSISFLAIICTHIEAVAATRAIVRLCTDAIVNLTNVPGISLGDDLRAVNFKPLDLIR
jgi:hypothetical protein